MEFISSIVLIKRGVVVEERVILGMNLKTADSLIFVQFLVFQLKSHATHQ